MSQTLMLDMLSLLVSASVKGSIILVLALVALRLMRRTSAAARHAVLAAALATFLLLPAVQAVAPSWTLAVLPAAPAEISALSQRMTPSLAPRGEPFTAPLESSGDQVLRSTAHPDVASHDASSQPFGVVLDWRQVIVALWLLGAACIVLRLLAGVAGVWLLERRATMVTDGVWLHTAHALAQRLGLARGVTLLSGDRGSVPLTWGVLQPVVWLPSGAAEWDVERRTVVLAHELAHVKRRDAITQWAANLSIALHWFNPLVWVVVRRLRVERERACDDAVLTLGTQPAVYAEHLLDIVRAIGGRAGPAAAMAMARRTQFEGRLLAILDGAAPRTGPGATRMVAIAAIAILLALPLAGMTPVLRGESRAPADIPGQYSEQGGYPSAAVSDGAPAPAELPPSKISGGPEMLSGREDLRGFSTLITPSDRTRAAVGSLLAGENDGDRFLERAATSGDSITLLEIIAAAAEISSSVERARVLTHVAQVGTLEPTVIAALLAATESMSSSVEKVRVIRALIDGHPDAARTSGPELIRAIESIASSVERANLLQPVLERQVHDSHVLTLALAAAATVPSTVERARLIRTVLRTQPAALSAAAPVFFALIDSINSSVERASLLVEVVQRPNVSDAVLVRALESAQGIASGVEKLRVLLATARVRTLTGEARSAYIRAARTISSGNDRAQALSAILPGDADSGSAAPPRSSRDSQRGSSSVYVVSDTTAGVARHVRVTWLDVDLRAGGIVAAGRWGSVNAEERSGPADGSGPMVTRRMLVSVNSTGEVVYDYCVDDESRPIDQQTRAWFRRLMEEARGRTLADAHASR